MRAKIVAIAILLGLGLGVAGCRRRVVVEPEAVKQKNASDWTVKGEPAKAPPAPGEPPAK